MRKTSWLFVSLALVATLGLACGDDTEPVLDSGVPDQAIYPDQMVYMDMGDDIPWTDTMQPDQAVDMAVDTVTDDMTEDLPTSEAGADMAADMAADMGSDVTSVDMSADTMTIADAGTSSGKCTAPTLLTLPASGKITVSGDTAGAANEFGKTIECGTGFDLDGSQVYYQIALKAKTYLITLTPTTSWDPALVVFKDKTCTAATIEAECSGAGGAGADNALSGKPELLAFTPTAAGDFIISADTFSSTATGKFTLTIEEAVAPSNDACTSAKALSFTNNKITETSTTLLATNDVKLIASNCTGNTTDGPDVFYKVDLTAGATYKFKLDGSGFNEVLYLFTNCSSVASTCGTGMGADGWTSSSEEITFKPTTTDTYYVAVSGRAATDSGSFTLTIDAFPLITNDTCGTATAITLTGGKGTVAGHNLGSTNTVNLPSTGCTSDDTEGGDVWYSVSLTAGKMYKFEAVPSSGFNHSIYLLSSCTNPTTACVAGANAQYSGTTEIFTYKPTTSGTFYVAVDTHYAATSSYAEGSFTLNVDEVAKPAHDTCTGAKTLTFTSGAFSEKGELYGATDTVNLTASDCTGNTTAGPDVFYKVAVTKGNAYTFDLSSGDFNEALYVFTTCGSVASTCGTGMGADSSTSSSESVSYTAAATGTIYVGVDTRAAGETGSFTLTGVEKVVSANNTCASAETLTMSSGSATSTGDTAKATNTVSLTSSSCISDTSAGPDLFYKITLAAGTYTVTVTPASGYDPSLYAFTACATPEASCVAGIETIGSGTAETITLTPTTQTTYYIGVDSWYSSSSSGTGTFTIEVK